MLKKVFFSGNSTHSTNRFPSWIIIQIEQKSSITRNRHNNNRISNPNFVEQKKIWTFGRKKGVLFSEFNREDGKIRNQTRIEIRRSSEEGITGNEREREGLPFWFERIVGIWGFEPVRVGTMKTNCVLRLGLIIVKRSLSLSKKGHIVKNLFAMFSQRSGQVSYGPVRFSFGSFVGSFWAHDNAQNRLLFKARWKH